jgi:hypothetical protein
LNLMVAALFHLLGEILVALHCLEFDDKRMRQ